MCLCVLVCVCGCKGFIISIITAVSKAKYILPNSSFMFVCLLVCFSFSAFGVNFFFSLTELIASYLKQFSPNLACFYTSLNAACSNQTREAHIIHSLNENGAQLANK